MLILVLKFLEQTEKIYLKNAFKPNERYKFFGKVSRKYGTPEMQSPVYENEATNRNTGKIIPIYPLTYNLSQNTIRKIIENGLGEIEGKLEETLTCCSE